MIRDYFLGANTPKGFYSYYNHLIDREDAEKIYIIKGGPGTGKSSLMKSVAQWGIDKGFDIDQIHCSSDPSSLDGVVIPDIKIAMVDGTAPHVVDPKFPGAVDVIINMGNYWDESEIVKCRKEIIECTKAISDKFTEAYKFLAAAGNIRGNGVFYKNEVGLQQAFLRILSELHFAGTGKGRVRKLFAEGITPEGLISHADTLDYGKKIILKSDNPADISYILNLVHIRLCEMGYDHEVFYSPLNPSEEIRHIVVPEENVCILTGDMFSLIPENNATVIELDSTDNAERDRLKCRLIEMTLISRATAKLSEAKKLHDRLEKFYYPHIDFEAVGKMKKNLISQLEEYSHKTTAENKMVEEK